MNVKVTVQEIKIIERTYMVKDVNTLDNASKCAMRSILHQYQPNTQLWQEVPLQPQLKTIKYEVVE